MSDADGLPPLRDVIARFGLSAKKNLGQNFLLDLNLTRKIARSAGSLDDHTIIEIGPGPGGLTRALLMEGARKVIAIERDERVLPALQQISEAYPGRLDVISADALKADWKALANGPVRIVANLPYNIATALLVNWLDGEDWPPFYASLTLMFQKEVAERIIAAPGSKTYGRLSVLSQWRGKPEKLFDVPSRAFTPAPKVISSIVHLVPTTPIMSCRTKSLATVTKAAFGQRRKMLRASLKSLLPNPSQQLKTVGIEETARAEQLDVADFCRLAQLI